MSAPGDHIKGWMTDDELNWLVEISRRMLSVVEIGSWCGRSTFALCTSGTQVTAVDHFCGSSEHQELIHSGLDPRAEFHKNLDHFTNLTLLDMESAEAEKQIQSVDMVFIDGAHEYENVKEDIKLWAPKARKVLCGHDWAYPSVQKALQEHFGRNPDQVIGNIWAYDMQPAVAEKKNLVVCLPGMSYSSRWVANWTNLFVYLACRYRVGTAPAYSSNIYECRNACLSMIPPGDIPDYVLWIDSDNIVTPEGFEMLHSSLQRPEVGLVGAWYPMQATAPPVPIAAGWGCADDRVTLEQISKANDLIEVDYIGLGFALMKYEVLKTIGERPFRPRPRPAPRYFTTDDEGFCESIREAGFRVWLHPQVYSAHLKLGDLPIGSIP